jgi:hypothetical protein
MLPLTVGPSVKIIISAAKSQHQCILQRSDTILVDIYGLKKWWILNFTRNYGGFLQFDDVAVLFVVEPTRKWWFLQFTLMW